MKKRTVSVGSLLDDVLGDRAGRCSPCTGCIHSAAPPVVFHQVVNLQYNRNSKDIIYFAREQTRHKKHQGGDPKRLYWYLVRNCDLHSNADTAKAGNGTFYRRRLYVHKFKRVCSRRLRQFCAVSVTMVL